MKPKTEPTENQNENEIKNDDQQSIFPQDNIVKNITLLNGYSDVRKWLDKKIKELKITDLSDPNDLSKRPSDRPCVLSPSQIITFLTCPRKWYLQNVKKIREPVSIPAFIGTVIHHALELFWDEFNFEMVKGYEYDFFNREIEFCGNMQMVIMNYLRRAYADTMNTYKQQEQKGKQDLSVLNADMNEFKEKLQWKMNYFAGFYIRNLYWSVARQLMKGKYGYETIWKFQKPKQSEMEIIQKDADGNWLFIVRIDKVIEMEGMTVLVDYKTAIPFMIPLSKENNLQLSLYAAIYSEYTETKPDYVMIEYVLTGQSVYLPITDLQIKESIELIRLIRKVTASFNEDDYPCIQHKFCSAEFCPVWAYCNKKF